MGSCEMIMCLTFHYTQLGYQQPSLAVSTNFLTGPQADTGPNQPHLTAEDPIPPRSSSFVLQSRPDENNTQ